MKYHYLLVEAVEYARAALPPADHIAKHCGPRLHVDYDDALDDAMLRYSKEGVEAVYIFQVDENCSLRLGGFVGQWDFTCGPKGTSFELTALAWLDRAQQWLTTNPPALTTRGGK